MKIRYCSTPNEQIVPCQKAWGKIDCNCAKACWDDPKEDNCNNLIEIKPLPNKEQVK